MEFALGFLIYAGQTGDRNAVTYRRKVLDLEVST
jgi:hypothetical protein